MLEALKSSFERVVGKNQADQNIDWQSLIDTDGHDLKQMKFEYENRRIVPGVVFMRDIENPTMITGAEVLARVVAEDGTVESPRSLIYTLERTGSISDLDFFMMDVAQNLAEAYPDLIITSNVGSGTMRDKRLMDRVEKYYESGKRNYVMEILEHVAAFEAADIPILRELVAAGAQFCIDDYGERNSLKNLQTMLKKNIPLRMLKIANTQLEAYLKQSNMVSNSPTHAVFAGADTIVFESGVNTEISPFIARQIADSRRGFAQDIYRKLDWRFQAADFNSDGATS